MGFVSKAFLEKVRTELAGVLTCYKMYTLLYSKWMTNKTYWMAHGTLLNVMCHSGRERVLEGTGYMYMYG